MKSLKFILLAAVFCSTLVACTETDLNEDEPVQYNQETVYPTGGQQDSSGGLD